MSLISGQLQQLSNAVAKFAKCKSCQKRLYKSQDDSDVSLEGVATKQQKVEEYRALLTPPSLHPCPASMPMPVASSTPAQKNSKVSHVQKSTDNKDEDSNTMILVGSASRGIYLSKKKVDLLSKKTPRLFALKLFELVFRREEAKGGSVAGKGEKLCQLVPNQMAAVREHTKKIFCNEVNWSEIKKGFDEKCRMVCNNRCTQWAGMKTSKD